MTDSEIARLEESMGLVVPQAFRGLLLDPSGIPKRMLEERFLVRDIAWLISTNQAVRKDGFCGSAWPNDFIVIGADPGGNLWFVTANGPDSRLYLADHEVCFEEGDHEIVADSASEYVSYLCQLDAEWSKDSIPPLPTPRNILQRCSMSMRPWMEEVIQLSSPNELEEWWTSEVGWNCSDVELESKVRQRRESLRQRARSAGWECA